jgi:hypothetical protein
MLSQAVDTVFVVAPATARSVAADWALVILGAAAAVGIVVAVPLIFQLRNGLRSLRRASKEVERRADPLLERGKVVGANLEFITTTLKHDVEALNSAIRSLSDRLTQASNHMEERVHDFNALMEVVQSEAEGVFVDTAATARGVRAGARHLAGRTGGERRAGQPKTGVGPEALPEAPVDPSPGQGADEAPEGPAPPPEIRPHGDALTSASVGDRG